MVLKYDVKNMNKSTQFLVPLTTTQSKARLESPVNLEKLNLSNSKIIIQKQETQVNRKQELNSLLNELEQDEESKWKSSFLTQKTHEVNGVKMTIGGNN